jgi:membrane-bound serine protease (ClpP class)
MTLALVLLGVGLLLIMAEVLIPSFGMLGGLAAIALIGSVLLAYQVSSDVGRNFLIAEAVLVPSMVMLGFKLLPKSPLTKFLVADGFSFEDGAAIDERDKDLMGKRGVVEAPLRPAGTARIEGRRVDVVTRGDMIESGAWVEVTRLSGNRVEVVACEGPEPPDQDTQQGEAPSEP